MSVEKEFQKMRDQSKKELDSLPKEKRDKKIRADKALKRRMQSEVGL